MFAALSLLTFGFLLASPALAAHWAVTYQPNGNSTAQGGNPIPWNNPPVQNDFNSDGSLGENYHNIYTGTGCNGTMGVTLTWTKDGEPTLPPAPAQVSVLVTVACDASGTSGSISDGFGDPFSGNGTVHASGTFTHLVQLSNSSLLTVVLVPGGITVHVSSTGSYPTYTHAWATWNVQIFTATLQAHSTVDTGSGATAWDPVNPRFFSGTYCNTIANAVPISGYITHMQVDIGGTLVAEYDDTAVTALTSNQGTAPNKVQYQTGTNRTSYTLTTMFDSTHFANNSQVPVQMEVIDNTGYTYYSNIHGPAVNNAFLMYNNNGLPNSQPGSVYDQNGVQEAKQAAQDVSAALTSTHITASALDSTDNVTGIEGKLSSAASQYTVFFAADHGGIAINGNTYVLGDCLATPSNAADWLTDSNISTAVNQAAASPTQPPYNFVYLHTCNSGNTTGFANDFGIPGASSGDRAMIGFTNNPKNNTPGYPSTPTGYAEDGELAVNSQNTLYTQTLWQQLLAGNFAAKAIDLTKTSTGGAQEFYEPTQQGQQGVFGAVNSELAYLMAGSSNYTLANSVYLSGTVGQWFQ